MTDTRLQSFCERCGKRYTSDAPIQSSESEGAKSGKSRLSRLARRGPDKGEEEAPAVSTTSPPSDACAGTFHFCMDCRQYVCSDCWNAEAGGCLSDRPPNRGGQPVAGEAARRSPFAASSEPKAWPNADASKVMAAGAGSVDEWGRTRALDETTSAHAVPAEGTAGELDPWRGVVFTDAERGGGSSATAPKPAEPATPAPTIDFGAERGAPARPVEAWPEIDRKPAPAQADASAWPTTDRRLESEPEVPPEPTATPAGVPLAITSPGLSSIRAVR